MHTHVHTYMHTPTHAEQPYNRFDRSLGFIKELREFSIAKRSTKRYTCVCVYVLNHIFHQLSCCSVAQSCLTLWSRGLKHSKLPCLSPSPGAYSNSSPLSQWCHPTISSSVAPFSSGLQSFPASGSFPRSQCFTLGGQRIVASASASVLPMNIQDWFLLGWTGWISLLSKGLSRVFSNITVQKHLFFSAQLSL